MADNPAFRLPHAMASAMKRIDFPVDRDQLLEHAKQNEASNDVMAAEVMGTKND